MADGKLLQLEWFGCTTFRVRVEGLTLFFDTYVDRPPGLEVASVGVEAVVVRVEGRHSRLRRLHEEDFRAEVSLKSAQAGRVVGRIDTDNVSAPAGVRVVRVTPSEVRAILEARR